MLAQKCVSCKKEKDLNSFCSNKTKKNGKNPECKSCQSIRQRRDKHVIEAWRRTPSGMATCLRNHARERSKRFNLDFNLTKEWIIKRLKEGKCEVTGIKFDLETKRGPYSPSIDRIIPERGYTTENSQVVVWIYNCAKFQFLETDVLHMAEKLLESRGK